MTRFAILAALLACHAPNVARTVLVWPRTAVVQYPATLKCHVDAPCWYDAPYAAHDFAREDVICLTPAQERDAEERGE